jgi:MFS family permease
MTTQTENTSWIPALAATAGMVLVTMDIFMKPVAKKALEQDFGVDAGAIQAAISIFAIIYAGLCILGGKLGDMHGKKKIYIIGLALYGLSALVTTMAPTLIPSTWRPRFCCTASASSLLCCFSIIFRAPKKREGLPCLA